MPAMIAWLALQDAGFFKRPEVDFWGTRRRASTSVQPELFTEGGVRPPPEVLDLMASPTAENARRYLDLQREKMRRIQAAMAAVEKEAAKRRVSIEFFTLPGCPACARQEEELKDTPWSVTQSPPVEEHDRYPVLVLRSGGRARTLVGFHSREEIRRTVQSMEERRD
jgi:hypothetical protein